MLWRKIEANKEHPYHIEVDESIKAPKKQQGRGGRSRNQFAGKRPSSDNWKRNLRRNKNKRG